MEWNDVRNYIKKKITRKFSYIWKLKNGPLNNSGFNEEITMKIRKYFELSYNENNTSENA